MIELNPDIEHWGESESGAIFSYCPTVLSRYVLWRRWNDKLPWLLFVGVNASTAAKDQNDPTIKRLIRLAQIWGFGGLFAGNLVPIVSPDPKDMLTKLKTMSEKWLLDTNDDWLRSMQERSHTVLVAWGEIGGRYLPERVNAVLELLGPNVYCIKKTKSGQPVHPLYQPLTSKLVPYSREGIR